MTKQIFNLVPDFSHYLKLLPYFLFTNNLKRRNFLTFKFRWIDYTLVIEFLNVANQIIESTSWCRNHAFKGARVTRAAAPAALFLWGFAGNCVPNVVMRAATITITCRYLILVGFSKSSNSTRPSEQRQIKPTGAPGWLWILWRTFLHNANLCHKSDR